MSIFNSYTDDFPQKVDFKTPVSYTDGVLEVSAGGSGASGMPLDPYVEEYASGIFDRFGRLCDNEPTQNIIPKNSNKFLYDSEILDSPTSIYDFSNPITKLSETNINKLFAITHNNINITSEAGLRLKPIAKDLVARESCFPPQDSFYIDPPFGLFALPRPIYWNKLSNFDFKNNAEISKFNDSFYESALSENRIASGSKFGNDFIYTTKQDSSSNYKTLNIYPIGKRSLSKGSISFWVKGYSTAQSQFLLEAAIYNKGLMAGLRHSDKDGSTVRLSNPLFLSSEKRKITDWVNTSSFESAEWHHVYIIFDIDTNYETNTVAGGRKAKIFIDGKAESLSLTQPIDGEDNFRLSLTVYAPVQPFHKASVGVCNLQIWDFVMEDPVLFSNWIYNNGVGREDVVHLMYGETNNYKPNLKCLYYTLPTVPNSQTIVIEEV